MSTWVQHKSGIGEKWKVDEREPDESYFDDTWSCLRDERVNLLLPKSEYVECSPPETWQDVTEECEFSEVHNHLNLSAARAMAGQYVPLVSGYRFKKVFLTDNRYLNTWVLKVEKRQP
ncbi:MAG: hypothetical protein OJF50_002498 [Nitrospira sp.]|jgi:hypothetical protein|nr:hypothetical protein [Nitrospira sp.]